MFCQLFRAAALGCCMRRQCSAETMCACGARVGVGQNGCTCGNNGTCANGANGGGTVTGSGLVTVSRTASVGAVPLGSAVEIALAVTNASTVPLRIFVRDTGTAGLQPDNTGVAVDGIASSDRSIALGVDLGVVAAGQTVAVNYPLLAAAVGMQCGSAFAYFMPAVGEWEPTCAETVRSNRLCISVTGAPCVLPVA